MEHLPYIDEHRTPVPATRDHVWAALLAVLRTQLGGGALTRPLALKPTRLRGDWYGTPRPGDSLPGFEVTASRTSELLALRGEHRFSRYALVFELDASGPDECVLRAKSWAEFPGLTGRAYGALVVGTGGHRLAVRRLLRGIARRAR